MIDTVQKFPRKVPGRHKVRDTGDAYTYRMGAGFPGDVGRFPGTMIDPCQLNPTSGALQPGDACVLDVTTNTVRAVVAGDVGAGTAIYGVVVRVYPFQQATGGMTATYGNQALAGPIVDVLRRGYIMVSINGVPNKGTAPFVWAAASAGNHVQGRWEIVASGGNTIALTASSLYNGPGDSLGVGELMYNI